jgi:hypothetical protein
VKIFFVKLNIDYNFAMNKMRTLTIIALIVFCVSCKKNNKTAAAAPVNDSDVSELLSPDDNFKEKKSRKNKKKDTVEISFIAFRDLNNDGIRDTAFLVHNLIRKVTTINFSGIQGAIVEKNGSKIHLKDIGDLNNDGKHEIMMTLQAEESCWDEVKLYSYLDNWVEKYNGLTYQCTENNNYQFRKIDDKTVQLVTYGLNKDSIDSEIGDTLENVIPNARMEHLIRW